MSDASCKLLRLLYLFKENDGLRCRYIHVHLYVFCYMLECYMKEKSSGKGSRSSGKSFLSFSYLMWNNGLMRCGLKSATSFCGDETFGQCVEQLVLPKINVGRRFCTFFEGIVLSDGGIGFCINSCFIQWEELRKFVSVLL